MHDPHISRPPYFFDQDLVVNFATYTGVYTVILTGCSATILDTESETSQPVTWLHREQANELISATLSESKSSVTVSELGRPPALSVTLRAGLRQPPRDLGVLPDITEPAVPHAAEVDGGVETSKDPSTYDIENIITLSRYNTVTSTC